MSLLLQERRFPPGRWLAMETSQDYRKFAEECRRLAKEVKDGEHKRALEQMAAAWLRLAREAGQEDS
jgi:DNA primase